MRVRIAKSLKTTLPRREGSQLPMAMPSPANKASNLSYELIRTAADQFRFAANYYGVGDVRAQRAVHPHQPRCSPNDHRDAQPFSELTRCLAVIRKHGIERTKATGRSNLRGWN